MRPKARGGREGAGSQEPAAGGLSAGVWGQSHRVGAKAVSPPGCAVRRLIALSPRNDNCVLTVNEPVVAKLQEMLGEYRSVRWVPRDACPHAGRREEGCGTKYGSEQTAVEFRYRLRTALPPRTFSGELGRRFEGNYQKDTTCVK